MFLRSSVGVKARLALLISGPIDETGVMTIDKDRPLSHGKMDRSFLDSTVFIDVAFVFAVGESASIYRICGFVRMKRFFKQLQPIASCPYDFARNQLRPVPNTTARP